MKTVRTRNLLLSLLSLAVAGCTYEYIMDENHEIGKAKVDTEGYDDYDGINVSNAYLPIDWSSEGSRVETYDTLTGRCRIRLEDMDDARKIGKGTIMTLDADSVIYLRRVVSAHADGGGGIDMETESVSLAEVLPESHFEIRIGRDPSKGPTRSASGNRIFYPTEMRQKNSEGKWIHVPYSPGRPMTRTTTEEDEARYDFAGDAWYDPVGYVFTSDDWMDYDPTLDDSQPEPDYDTEDVEYDPSEYDFSDEGPYAEELAAMQLPDDAQQTATVPIAGKGEYSHGSYTIPVSYNLNEKTPLNGSVTIGYGRREVNEYQMIFDLHVRKTPSKIAVMNMTETWDTLNFSLKMGSGFAATPGTKAQIYADNKYKRQEVKNFLQDAINKENSKRLKNHQEIINLPGPTVVVPLGPLIFAFQINANVDVGAEFSLCANLDVSFSKRSHVSGKKSGFLLDKEGAHRIVDAGKETNNLIMNKLVVEGSAGVKIGVTPEVNFLIYGTVGPYVGAEFSVGAGLSLGAGLAIPDDMELTDYDAKNLICAGYEVEVKAGVSLAAGIAENKFVREIIDKYMGKASEIRDKLNIRFPLTSKTIYESPARLRLNTKGNVKVNEPNELEFELLTSQNAPHVIWHPLHFSAGEDELSVSDDPLSKKNLMMFSELKTGLAHIVWTPKSSSSKLTAYYDKPDGSVYTVVVRPDASPDGCEAVDLGVSCLWASMNVGSTTPYQYGAYVGWGDATGKSTIQGYDTKWGLESFEPDQKTLFNSYGGENISKNISGTGNDYARAKWGGNWRIPTQDEWHELIMKCDWEWNKKDEVYKIMNHKDHDQFIILPANGYRIGNTYMNKDETAEYWTSDMYTLNKSKMDAYYFFGKLNHLTATMHSERFNGHGIRPVMNK